MPIPFADGLRTRVVFTGGSKSAIIDQVRQTLVDVGWSGAAGDEYHNSAITPQGLQCRVRVHDDGGNCAVVQFRNVPETQIGRQHFLLPKAAPVEYCIIANQYQFFVLVINQPTQARTFVAGGVPFMDPPLYTPTRFITEAIWSQGNGLSDTDTTVGVLSFRNSTTGHASWTETNGIYTANYFTASANSRASNQCLVIRQALSTATVGNPALTGYLHHGGQSNKIPARIMWGRIDSDGDPPGSFRRIMGTLWDIVLINTPPVALIIADSLHEFDDYKWHCITSGVDSIFSIGGICCVFVAYEAVI
jgi:hypothetical protein